jgi:hypothetical protein
MGAGPSRSRNPASGAGADCFASLLANAREHHPHAGHRAECEIRRAILHYRVANVNEMLRVARAPDLEPGPKRMSGRFV